ncbi:MAG: lycopene beta-cyclase CrtY [Enterobacteriaceae bacterium PSpyr]|nr:MAG: lycopene beta-cyclase CrtY [Enterobacteriaceae bacterium PSpyr]
MNNKYDIIFIGLGLSNSLIALSLLKTNLKILIIEERKKINSNHIWSFFKFNIFYNKNNYIKNLIYNQWNKYTIKFPNNIYNFKNGYFCIKSNIFYKYLFKKLKHNLLLNTRVKKYSKNYIKLKNGNFLYCDLIIDGSGYYPNLNELIGLQLFLGQEWLFKKSHNLKFPIIMDSTLYQEMGFNFIYVIPLSKFKLLIEDTYYINNKILKLNLLRNNIFKYIKKNKWVIKRIIREEYGIIPIKLKKTKKKKFKNIILNGLRGELYNLTTGYSINISLKLSNNILKINHINCKKILNEFNKLSKKIYNKQKFYILLNAIFFLFIKPNKRYKLIQSFYNLPKSLINRFYLKKINFLDIIKIITLKPQFSYFKILCFIINYYFI